MPTLKDKMISAIRHALKQRVLLLLGMVFLLGLALPAGAQDVDLSDFEDSITIKKDTLSRIRDFSSIGDWIMYGLKFNPTPDSAWGKLIEVSYGLSFFLAKGIRFMNNSDGISLSNTGMFMSLGLPFRVPYVASSWRAKFFWVGVRDAPATFWMLSNEILVGKILTFPKQPLEYVPMVGMGVNQAFIVVSDSARGTAIIGEIHHNMYWTIGACVRKDFKIMQEHTMRVGLLWNFEQAFVRTEMTKQRMCISALVTY